MIISKKKFSNLKPKEFQIIIDSSLEILTESKFWNEEIINSKKAIYVSRYSESQVEKKINNNYQPELDYFCISSQFNTPTLVDYFKSYSKYSNKIFLLAYEYEFEKISWKKYE